ncbi:MAG: hypothetical protein ACI8P5_000889, partial [Bacteroidia bacterium]
MRVQMKLDSHISEPIFKLISNAAKELNVEAYV